jgi:hypothetical protein
MPGYRVLRSPSADIFLNLAIEDRLFRTVNPDERVLFLWTNAAAVVIGRYQNRGSNAGFPSLNGMESPWRGGRAGAERSGTTSATSASPS